MTTAALAINRSKNKAEELGTVLSPRYPSVTLLSPLYASSKVTKEDIKQMLDAARSGKSARSVIAKNCSYVRFYPNGKIEIRLPFSAWPTDPDMDYNLSVGGGELFGPRILHRSQPFDLIFQGDEHKEYPFYMESQSVAAEMPFFNPDGKEISPSVSYNAHSLTLSESAYAAFRVRGTAFGHGYLVKITMNKKQEVDVENEDGSTEKKNIWVKLSVPAVPVLCSWEYKDGSEGTAQMDLQVPDCVRALLESCPDGDPLGDGVHVNDPNITLEVYYSTCTGKVVAVREVEG